MAESDSKYNDSFISQEDLDSLMKEAEDLGPEAFSASAPAEVPESPAPSDDGEDVISQDDIDALLNLADDGSGAPDGDDDGEEVISQDDIDALLAGNAKPDPPPAPPVPQDDDVEDDTADLDLVSPEDIEKLLRTEDMADENPQDAPASSPANDLETITAEDLKDLAGSEEIKAEGGPVDGDDDSLISQDDIDALLSGGVPQAEPQAEPEAITPVPIQDSGEEEDDSLINQDDIDKLLAGTDGDDSDVAPETEKKPEPEPEPETVADPQDSTEDDSNLISQEDIDKLLIGKSEEVESEETLIDQDDIDRLLSSAAPVEDEKLAGQGDQDKLISQEDIDRLLNEDISDAMHGEAERPIDQVVLEEVTDAGDSGEEKGKAAWYRSKLLVSGMAVALVLIVSVVVLSIFSGKSGQEEPPVAENIPETEAVQPEAVPEESYPLDDFTPRTYDVISVTMNDFVVPAPAKVKGLSYIALDLTFEISDAPSNPIKDYEPFFRNIVYEVLNKAFILQSESKIVEADLKNMIRNALNDALSEGSVSQIEFINFKVG